MDSPLVTVMLPAVLAVIMLGLGLSLTVGDFRRVREYPKTVLVALGCQLVLLPAVCFGLVVWLGLSPALAVGMLLLAASPGGTMANLYSHLFGGDVALNITLTAINSVLAVFTLPLVVNLATAYFSVADGRDVGLRFEKSVQVFAVVLVPVAVGMWVRARRPRIADRADRPVKVMSLVVLALIIVGAVVAEAGSVGGYLLDVGLAVLAFSCVSLAVGYGAARLASAGHGQAVAVCMEIGMHNTSLSLTIALSPSLLDSTRMAVPSAVYGIVMYFTAGAAGLLLRRAAAARVTGGATGRQGSAPPASGAPTGPE
ncbi:bile acid:sodium symporter family protein [Streptomyces iconiensis]|uniref:Bile acid:sodium symporter family protein n=1 Tax=Streptomyces iconiensis TaxID=1384038 RepID=A0ABT6ZWM1_9ACTN|nr:bile acid:sodium symporter family protein [Streptomyces iconiensis]MDJ1133470.1 bile acid:sodium symporter family protein [Streptomyces iconiensis]